MILVSANKVAGSVVEPAVGQRVVELYFGYQLLTVVPQFDATI